MQLVRGGLLAAGGMLIGAAAPASTAQAAAAVAAASEPALAAGAATEIAAAASQHFSKVLLSTLADCELAVSVFPTFSYNAAGGGGTGSVTERDDGLLNIVFDPATLNIPPINAQHASIIGIPIPPPLNIAIVPQASGAGCCWGKAARGLRLEGTLDPATGRVDLDFLASFEFTAGPIYRAAPLTVATTLTTEASDGVLRHGVGERLRADGRARLVGVARVPRTTDGFLNTFLMLPTDALAVLSAELKFS
ncbi:hypothetical protein COHA_001278 [Chlorella ohadii]|uniref:Lipid/polyisoprenoid-binding YceI-like domain-containing protein n=1 Tax=Chlorella ohadii TaxID=2649997 RepID=A0AAD5E271_9CHLO|nr:hypothetical protein COHA_001278 [Chlorella ohadii]